MKQPQNAQFSHVQNTRNTGINDRIDLSEHATSPGLFRRGLRVVSHNMIICKIKLISFLIYEIIYSHKQCWQKCALKNSQHLNKHIKLLKQ